MIEMNLFGTGRKICHFVPRRYQKLIGVPILIFLAIIVLIVTHMFGKFVGIATQEMFATDADVIKSIPSGNNFRTPEFVNFTKRVIIYPENVTRRITKRQNGENAFISNQDLQLCKKETYKIVFLIRLPKCASTSFVNVLKKISNQGHLHFTFNPSGAYDWDLSTMSKTAELVRKESSSSGQSYLYARHFYHVNFMNFGIVNYTYVAIVREPVARFISSYLYYHLSSKQHIQSILDPKHRNESLKACFELGHEGCQLNLLTRYFCGHQPVCKTSSKESFYKAKQNIQEYFTVVGIMEDMTLSYKLMKHLIPSHFNYLNPDSDAQKKHNRNEHMINISKSLREEIEEKNKYDMLLYYYIRERLYYQAKVCSIFQNQ